MSEWQVIKHLPIAVAQLESKNCSVFCTVLHKFVHQISTHMGDGGHTHTGNDGYT